MLARPVWFSTKFKTNHVFVMVGVTVVAIVCFIGIVILKMYGIWPFREPQLGKDLVDRNVQSGRNSTLSLALVCIFHLKHPFATCIFPLPYSYS